MTAYIEKENTIKLKKLRDDLAIGENKAKRGEFANNSPDNQSKS